MRSARRLFLVAAVIAAVANASPAGAADPVIAAAGDIACAPTDPGYNGGNGTATRCRQRATSDLLVGAGLAAVLPLGDIQYDSPTAAESNAVYDPTGAGSSRSAGRCSAIMTARRVSYFDYFNGPGAADGPAGARGRGYYSFDVGSWHIVALNSNCTRCRAGRARSRSAGSARISLRTLGLHARVLASPALQLRARRQPHHVERLLDGAARGGRGVGAVRSQPRLRAVRSQGRCRKGQPDRHPPVRGRDGWRVFHRPRNFARGG